MDDSLRTPLLLSTIDDMEEEGEEKEEGEEETEGEGEEKKSNGGEEERREKMLTMRAASIFLKKKKSTQRLTKGSGSSNNLLKSLNSATLAHSTSTSSISTPSTSNVLVGDHLYARTLTQKRNELCTQVGLANAMDGTVTTGSGRLSKDHRLFPLFRYHHDGREREPPKKDCFGHQPNLHEALFWNFKHGHHALYSYLTTTMLMIALYVGCLSVNFARPVFQFVDSWEMLFFLSIVAIFPVCGHMVEFSILLPKLLLGMCVHADPKYLSNVYTVVNLYINFIFVDPLFSFFFFLLFSFYNFLPKLFELVTSIHEMSSSELTAKTTHIMRSQRALRMLMYACAIKDAHKVAMNVRTKGLRGATFSKLTKDEQNKMEKECKIKTFPMGKFCRSYYIFVLLP